jgi:hypothetical protein
VAIVPTSFVAQQGADTATNDLLQCLEDLGILFEVRSVQGKTQRRINGFAFHRPVWVARDSAMHIFNIALSERSAKRPLPKLRPLAPGVCADINERFDPILNESVTELLK